MYILSKKYLAIDELEEDNDKDVLAKNENNDNSEENVNLRIKPKKMIFKV